MGLAAKIAAAGAAGYVANQAYDHHQQQHQGGSAPGQYGAAGAAAYAAYGGQQAPQQYSTTPAMPQQAPQLMNCEPLIQQKLSQLVAANALHVFYPADVLRALASRVARIDWRGLAARWNLPVELCLDLAGLALYDVVIYCDDSGSMKFQENGSRIDDLKAILDRVTSVATLFDSDGISLRAMNFKGMADHVRTSEEAAAYVAQFQYNGLTPMGEMLEKKIIEPILEKSMAKKTLKKPVLVITITDGEPSERPGKVQSEIAEAKRHCKRSVYGVGAIAFAFAQVGKDVGAQKFLATLDNDKDVGGMVDCTSYYELEQAECMKKGVNLTPDMWMLKLMVGGFDKSYDHAD
eukprot:CAMPEP_0206152440 /NCGR_PEP_ID=MMETSP1473-20131121/39327_1 /ASSEMBLY_ACC=CAM_ASM_001109 /TAXON_ID=1461547 /ORGANISM="Stichococcus sp, Strain RCC1054" /LENGTH=348 /DNA_ID=CAMNT_0053549999 /DNA_START=127 /DNA_END=1173 /DNA_ORIENTATION=-